MRAILWTGVQLESMSLKERLLPTTLTYYLMVAEMVEPWKWPWTLISLFNEHEGLLFKMLLMFLRLEGETGGEARLASPLVQAILGTVHPAQLYVDLLERCGEYDVASFHSSIRAANPQTVARYLYRLYSRALGTIHPSGTLPHEHDGQQGDPATGVDSPYRLLFTHPKVVRFHQALLKETPPILPDCIILLLHRLVHPPPSRIPHSPH